LNFQLAHRKVLRIAGRQRYPEGDGRGSDQTVRLRQRHARRRMIASPVAGLNALDPSDRRYTQPIEEADRSNAFAIAQTPMDLLDTDRRCKWHVSMAAKRYESLDRSRSASQHID
jgi:hypothetical protein